jgi:glycosyltransferase involved in cell wall biosynthesis
MAAYTGTLVVVPTRNRADLAITAVRSVLAQEGADARVLVSDNSTTVEDVATLSQFCGEQVERVRYIRPPEPMSMTRHWEWVINEALRLCDASHVTFLTDRTIFKDGELAPLLRVASRHRDRVIVYADDKVFDYDRPVRLVQSRWTAKLVEVTSTLLLDRAARLSLHPVPRVLNCLVPRRVFETVRDRFGSVFNSISPDFCFAYRCLDVVDCVLYFDRAPILYYATDRSNGASFARGVASRDSADFVANLGGRRLNYASPVPEFHTVSNAIIHEYCCVKGETNSGRFRDVDRDSYLREMERGIAEIQNPELHREMVLLLRAQGPFARKPSVLRLMQRLLPLPVCPGTQPFWRFLTRRFRVYPPGDAPLEFATTEEAIAHANRYPRRRHRVALHLNALLESFTDVTDVPKEARQVRLRQRPEAVRSPLDANRF